MNNVSADTFEALIGQPLTVTLSDSDALELMVEKVDRLPQFQAQGGVTLDDGTYIEHPEPFSVVLKGPKEPLLDTQIYPISVSEDKVLHLLVGAFRQDGSGTWYEISFS